MNKDLLFSLNMRNYLKKWRYKMNQYNWCVMNNIIDGK